MQSDINKICLPMKKKMMFQVNQVIGINDMINPNIITFEHALEQIQNKLSLPEYNGPENFEEDQEEYDIRKTVDGTIRNECQIITCPQSFSQHSMLSKSDKEHQTLRGTGRKYRLINTTNVENKKKLRSDLKIHNSVPMKITPQYVAMKQMTLDKYSFQSNLLGTFTNSSCTIMISGGTCKSFDSKSFSHQNILFMRNSNLLQHFERCEALLPPNVNSESLSLWSKKNTPLENDPGSVALESKLYSTNKDVSDIETSDNDYIDKDSLDTDIENAMELFEADSSPILSYKETGVQTTPPQIHACDCLGYHQCKAQLEVESSPIFSYKETGVQTTPPQVHACNCLGYHQCKAFKGLVNKRCSASRSIAALDLDTLHHMKNSTQQSNIFERNVLQMKDLKTPETAANDLLNVNNKMQFTSTNSSNFAPQTSEIISSLEKKEFEEKNTKQENTQILNYTKNDDLYSESWIHPHASSICIENGSVSELQNLNEMLHAKQADHDTEPCRQQESYFRTRENSLLSKPLGKMFNSNVDENNCSVQIKSGAKSTSFATCDEIKKSGTIYSEEKNEALDHNIPQATESNTETGSSVPTDTGSWGHAFQWKDLPRVSETAAERPYEDFLTLKPATQKLRRIGLSKKDKTSCLHPKRIQN